VLEAKTRGFDKRIEEGGRLSDVESFTGFRPEVQKRLHRMLA